MLLLNKSSESQKIDASYLLLLIFCPDLHYFHMLHEYFSCETQITSIVYQLFETASSDS